VFENRALRRIFGPKRDEVTRDWRKLHNEELHNLYSSPDIIRQVKRNEVGGACGTHARGEKIVQAFGGKARGKETTWKTKAEVGRWGQNGWKIGLWGVDWLRLAQDRNRWRAVVSAVMNLRVLAPLS
jgi:hypothetical protein